MFMHFFFMKIPSRFSITKCNKYNIPITPITPTKTPSISNKTPSTPAKAPSMPTEVPSRPTEWQNIDIENDKYEVCF